MSYSSVKKGHFSFAVRKTKYHVGNENEVLALPGCLTVNALCALLLLPFLNVRELSMIGVFPFKKHSPTKQNFFYAVEEKSMEEMDVFS